MSKTAKANNEVMVIDYPVNDVSVSTNFDKSWDIPRNNFANAESFEDDEALNRWKSKNGGNLSLSEKHYKNGEKSLLWDWNSGSRIIVTEPKNIESVANKSDGGIQAWIYNEVPIEDKITFNFGSKLDIENQNPLYTFEFNLNYKGWRTFWVKFKEDAININYQKSKNSNLEIMEILSPCNTQKGQLCFDIVELCDNIPWLRHHDYQVPTVRGTGRLGFWDCMYYSNSQPVIPLENSISDSQIKAFDIIANRYDKWVFGNDYDLSIEPIKIRKDSLDEYIKLGKERYDMLNITRGKDGNIKGMPLFAHRSMYGPKFRDVATKIFMPLVFDYKINKNVGSKEKLMNLFDFYNDQGWAEGSSLQSLEHETLRSSGYFIAVYLMRNELRKTGRFDRELASMGWYIKIGSMFGYDNAEITADEVRTHSIYKLLYILALDNTPKKVQYMKEFLKWMNGALRITPGYASTIKQDFTGFHHRAIYASAYASHAYNTGSVVTYMLHGTEFALSDSTYNNLKNALLTQRIISNKYDVPICVSGRFPDKNTITHELIHAYAYLALSSNPIDKEMAQAFMSLWAPDSPYLKNGVFPRCGSDLVFYDTMGGLQLMLDLADKEYPKFEEPKGFWIKPYAPLAIQRRHNWMVATKCFSQYSWDYESSEFENKYGRYICYGCVQILANGNPVNTMSSGYNVNNGWNWNRWPGTTAINMPFEKMIDGGTDTHRNFSDETFVGGVSSEGENGLFSMKLHDITFNKSFRAKKSVFFFDNEIVCLGSDIENDDINNCTETTLFQSFIKNESCPFWLCSDLPITQVPLSKSFDSHEMVWMIDPYGNGYIIKNAEELHINRDIQKSIMHTGKKNTEGLYTTAWINHGKAPKCGEYEYTILVQSTPKKVAEYAQAPRYKVLQKNSAAHIVEHKALNTIGYSIFDENQEIVFAPIKKVSSPVMIMVKNEGNQAILSLADPDLRLDKPPFKKLPETKIMHNDTALSESKMKNVRVQLYGIWKVAEKATDDVRIIGIENETTILEFDCIHGKTIELKLIKK